MKTSLLTFACLIGGLLTAFAQPSQFNYHGLAGGGAQYSPSINPANPNEIYVACDMSGLYHSTDFGNSWDITNFQYVQAGHPTMVQFTNNPNIRYTLTFDNTTGNGYATKTTDGGATWHYITDATGGNGAWLICGNPQNSNQLIVTDYSNMYFSNDGGTTFGTAFYTDGTGAGAYIAGSFWDGMNIYICTNIGLLVSTNGGTSWTGPTMTGIPGTEAIVGCAGAKSGGTTRFFCITQGSGDVYVGETGDNNSLYKNLYTMDYGVTNWTTRETGITANDLPMYISMCSTNINVVYIAGNNGSTQYPDVMKTSNAGAAWYHVFNTANNLNIQTGWEGAGGDQNYGFDQYAFGFNASPSDTSHVVMTGEGFTHVTSDGGKTWQAAYVPSADLNPVNATTPDGKYYRPNGIEVTSVWDLMWYDSLSMFAGYTDITATRSIDGGNSWANDPGIGYNTVYKFATNPSNNVIYAATSSIHDMYESTHLKDANIDAGTGEVKYSIDGGATFSTMHNFGKPVIWLALDPTSSTRMYAGVINHAGSGTLGGIYVCNDIQDNATSVWTRCADPARTQRHPFNLRVLNDGTLVASYSGRINTAGKFTDSSGVFISTDHGTTWTDRSDPGMQYWTMDVVIDPWDGTQNTWFAGVFDNWGGPNNTLGGLYRTTNRGVNWTRIDTAAWVYSITLDPVHQGAAYITTQQEGLWYSPNIESATPTYSLTSYPFRQPNRVYFNPYNKNEVWVNSFGDGLRMGNLLANGIEEIKNNSGVVVYPNPSTGIFTIIETSAQMNSSGGQNFVSTVEIYNVMGEKIYSTNAPSNATGGRAMNVDISKQPSGVYLYRVLNADRGIIGEGKVVVE